jgi:hypothetical protein
LPKQMNVAMSLSFSVAGLPVRSFGRRREHTPKFRARRLGQNRDLFRHQPDFECRLRRLAGRCEP